MTNGSSEETKNLAEGGHEKKVTLPGIKKSGKKPRKKPGKKSGKKAATNLNKKAKDVVKESVDKVIHSGKKHAANRLKSLAKTVPAKIQAGNNLKIARKKVAPEKSEKKDKHIVTIEAAPEGKLAANETETTKKHNNLISSIDVGFTLKVYWPEDKVYYTAKVISKNQELSGNSNIVTLSFEDGEKETVDLTNEKFKIVHGRNSSTTRSDKKRKSSDDRYDEHFDGNTKPFLQSSDEEFDSNEEESDTDSVPIGSQVAKNSKTIQVCLFWLFVN